MSEITPDMVEDILRKEVLKLDKRVQVLGITQSKKEDAYRVTLLKDGRTGSADLKKDVIAQYVSSKSKGKALRKALSKAVSHLSITFRP